VRDLEEGPYLKKIPAETSNPYFQASQKKEEK